MKLSIRLICEEISELFNESSINSICKNDVIERVMLLDNLSECGENILYVTKASQLNENYKDRSLIKSKAFNRGHISCACVGKPSEAVLQDSHLDIIYSTQDCSLHRILNEIQNVFKKYELWDDTLRNIVVNRGSLKNLIEASLDYVQNDIRVVDQYERVIAYSVYRNVRYTKEEIQEIKEGEYLPQRMIADGDEDQAHGRDFISPGPKFHYMQAHKSATLDNTIYLREDYRIELTIESNYRNIEESDYARSMILGGHIQALYAGSDVYSNSEFDQGDCLLIRESLRGKVIDESLLIRMLQSYGWNVEHDALICLALKYFNPTLGKSRRSIEPELVAMSLLREFCICRTLIFENGVFVLLNIDKSAIPLDDLLNALPKEVMINNMACGASDVFTSVSEIRGRYKQATQAMEVSKERYGSSKVAKYTNEMLDITFDCVAQTMPPSFYAPKELLDLIERDNRHNSSLYETLKTYLYNCCSIAETCRQLFLNRNGAIYRLDKAKELLPSFDLNDAKDRLKLMLAMEIIDEGPVPESTREAPEKTAIE